MGKWVPDVFDYWGERIAWVIPYQAARAGFHYQVPCKFCGSHDVVRYGISSGGGQRYLCKACKRTFVDNDAPPGMRYPVDVIASVLNQFYESASLDKIRRQIQLDKAQYPGHAAVYDWIVRYTKIAVSELEKVRIRVGNTWVADETVLKLKQGHGENVWFWDIIDEKTRFLLASHLTPSRYTRDARTLMERAARRARKIPKTVITDRLRSYLDGIELAFGADTKHVQSQGFATQPNTNLIERFHSTLKSRTKVMRAMATRETAKLVMEGWLVHYNFFRPHGFLKNQTPAQAAGVKDASYESWADVVRGGKLEYVNPLHLPEVGLQRR